MSWSRRRRSVEAPWGPAGYGVALDAAASRVKDAHRPADASFERYLRHAAAALVDGFEREDGADGAMEG